MAMPPPRGDRVRAHRGRARKREMEIADLSLLMARRRTRA